MKEKGKLQGREKRKEGRNTCRWIVIFTWVMIPQEKKERD